MPPGFDTLLEQDLQDDEEEIDFSGKHQFPHSPSVFRGTLPNDNFFSTQQISERNMKSG